MTVDLIGIAAVIVAIGTPLTVVFAQFNTRRAIRDAEIARKADAAAAAEAARKNTVAVAEVRSDVNGKHTEALREIVALRGEVVRLQQPDATTPGSDAAVTLAPDTATVTVQPAAGIQRTSANKDRASDAGDG